MFFINRFFLKFLLNAHTLCYKYSGIVASKINKGIHPKHDIMRYKEWFLANIEPNWVVLDVGCNTGMMPEVMSQKANFVYGVELDCKLVEEAKKIRQKGNVEFICADATMFDYANLMGIDCITLSNVLEHIEHRVEFLQKLVEKVKWRGDKRLLIRVPMIDREWIVPYKKELGVEWRLDDTHYTEYTFEQFSDEMHCAGIKIADYHIRWGEIYAVCEA